MPQQFQILRCYCCEKFQVHQTKKATKWQCKVCGEKQSFKEAYFIGSARDCRLNVQQLNFKDGERKQNFMIEQANDCSEIFEESSVANRNHVDESKSCDDCFQSFSDVPTQHDNYMPKKKARYEPDPSFESYSESQSVLSSIFLEEDKTSSLSDASASRPDISSHEENITFDVSFDVYSPSSKVPDLALDNKNATADSKSKRDQCFNVDTHLPRKRPAATKNRGFQLILNAAKKLT